MAIDDYISIRLTGKRSTTDGVELAVVTTEGSRSDYPAGSGKQDPRVDILWLYAPQVCFTYHFVSFISYALGTIVIYFCLGGLNIK